MSIQDRLTTYEHLQQKPVNGYAITQPQQVPLMPMPTYGYMPPAPIQYPKIQFRTVYIYYQDNQFSHMMANTDLFDDSNSAIRCMRYELLRNALKLFDESSDVKLRDLLIDSSKAYLCKIHVSDTLIARGIVAEVQYISPDIVYYRGYSINKRIEENETKVRVIDERDPYEHDDYHYKVKNNEELWFKNALEYIDECIIDPSTTARYNSNASIAEQIASDNAMRSYEKSHQIEIINKYLAKELTADAAALSLGISKTKFYNLVRPYR